MAAANTPTVTFGQAKYYGSSPYSDVATYSAMSASLPSYVTWSVSGNRVDSSITATNSGGDYQQNTILVAPVTISVVVPAYSVYSVQYTTAFTNNGNYGRLAALDDAWSDTPLTDYTTYDGPNFAVGNPTAGLSGAYFGNSLGVYPSGYGFVFYNDTAAAKTFNKYTFYEVHVGHGGTDGAVYTQSVDFTFTTTVERVDSPATSASVETYDGTNKTFAFNYSTHSVTAYGTTVNYDKAYENITASVSSALTYGNNPISPTTYSLSTVGANGTLTALEAGTYTVEFTLNASAIAGGIEWDTGGTAAKTITFEIKRKAVAAPTVLNSVQTYKGGEYEFGLSGYDGTVMSVPSSGGYVSNNGSTITWDQTAEKFKATDAADYTVKFHLDSENYVWSVGGAESSSDQTKTIKINKKDLTINTTPSASSNPSWSFQATGDITYAVTAAGITSPNFVLNVYYVEDGNPSNLLTAGIDTTANKLDVSQIASTGKYKLCIELSSAAANKNYSITGNKFEMPFEIKAGGIDFSVIEWLYSEDGGSGKPLFISGTQDIIRYKEDGGVPVKYLISANIPSGGYLQVDNSYNANGYLNGFKTEFNGATVNSGCFEVGTYKTRIALISDSSHLFNNSSSTSGSFGGNDTKGWYEISWEISKGKVDSSYLNNLINYIQYRTAGGAWTTYNPANPPQFGNGAIEVRVDPTKYPAGISNATVTVNDKNTAIGSYTAQVQFSYDPNFENDGVKSFTWEISAQSIDVDWTSEFWKDGNGDNVLDSNGAPYQIKVLNVRDELKQYIEYKYYIADSLDPSIRGAFIGAGDTGLQDLTQPPYNASSTNAVYVYVEAVLKSGVTQYKLSDTTGNPYANSILYRLGATNTLVKVTQNLTEMYYGDGLLGEGIFSILDTGTNGELDKSTYLDGIYIYDSDKNNLGLLKDFDGSKANVGVYTIEIKLNSAGEGTYTLTPGSKYTFTIMPKGIELPTVDTITFNNTFINLGNYLKGSYESYKDIIVLGGTVDGVKNANTPYTATLTLMDGNYRWIYPEGVNPSKLLVKFALADESYSVTGDDTVATYTWKINPYILGANLWNLNGKEGAVYSIPNELTEGLDVSVNYFYHTDKTSPALESGAAIETGKPYFVKAELIGADAGNFVFEDTGASVSDFVQYKIPQSGAAAFFGNALNFVKKNWLWFAIGAGIFLFLLLLIIILAATRRRRKEKAEERKLEKERKAEEKARKEEERRLKEEQREEEKRRREQEREDAKAKAEAERELQKAKAEAELAKMRAEMGMAGAGAMAMQAMAQPQQQPMQPQQQAMPQYPQMPQPYYPQAMPDMNSAAMFAKIEAELAEIKARQNMGATGYPQMPMMPAPNYGGGNDAGITALVQAQLAEMRAGQNAALNTQMELLKLQLGNGKKEETTKSVQGIDSAEAFGTALATMVRNLASSQPVQEPKNELPQKTEESAPTTVNTPTVYPPDAVITTTTTVDTTKAGEKPERITRENDNTIFDIDGFYDTFEENK